MLFYSRLESSKRHVKKKKCEYNAKNLYVRDSTTFSIRRTTMVEVDGLFSIYMYMYIIGILISRQQVVQSHHRVFHLNERSRYNSMQWIIYSNGKIYGIFFVSYRSFFSPHNRLESVYFNRKVSDQII